MTISCIIIDDEPIARRGIENYIKRIRFLRLTGSYSNTQNIESTILSGANLIFLDIKLHKTNGLQFYKNLFPNAPYAIVVSAYPEYALDGFELHVSDYLLKPVSFDRFQEAVLHIRDVIKTKENSQLVGDSGSTYFFIKCDNKLQKLLYEEVLYIESLSNYVVIYTEARKYVSYLSLSILMDKLPIPKFIRIHKSYVISMDKVDAVKNHEVIIKGHSLPIGKSYQDRFMDLVESRLIKK